MNTGINRIRLEFKVVVFSFTSPAVGVLIESDWNLKYMAKFADQEMINVLIESDWNLKDLTTENDITPAWVLIESDWNLK